MRITFLSMMVGGLAAIVFVAPGFAGDGPKCQQKSDKKTKVEKKMEKVDSFSYHQSGGFIGVDRRYEVKLSDLKNVERAKLEQLIRASGILNAKTEEKVTGGAADMFNYQFTVADGDEARTVMFDDGTLPESYRPLIAFLKDKVIDARKK